MTATRDISPEDQQALLELLHEGASVVQLTRAFKLPQHALTRWAHEAGYKFIGARWYTHEEAEALRQSADVSRPNVYRALYLIPSFYEGDGHPEPVEHPPIPLDLIIQNTRPVWGLYISQEQAAKKGAGVDKPDQDAPRNAAVAAPTNLVGGTPGPGASRANGHARQVDLDEYEVIHGR